MKYSANSISRVPAPSITQADSSLSMQSATPAAALRAVAGSPSGLYQTRRGSFMILVVGTLALLAVITLLYVGIGRSDRSGAAATVRSNNTEAVPEAFKDYAAQIIADSGVAIFEPGAFVTAPNVPANQREFIRKTWDYPGTDWRLQTYITDPDDARYFTPTGGRTGTTPFLASADPTWLNFSLTDPARADNEGRDVYKKYNDWTHISNFAPDGAFINLYNLRSNFAASPRQMRQNLFALNATGNPGQLDFGRGITLVGGVPANPADLSMRQANMFREVKFSNGALVDNYDWLAYSYCDNDGDGLYDGRWFEMRDWRDTTSIAFRSLLPQDQNYRWVFSSTCIDLTGKVNVNTATDFFYQGASPAGQPTAELPVGVTPAEVDLLRILSLYDGTDLYGKSYLDFNQPPLAAAINPENYGNNPNITARYTPANAANIGKLSFDWIRRSVQGSLTLRTSIDDLPGYSFQFATPLQRYAEYLLHAGRTGELSASGSGTPDYSSSGGFPIADQVELLTYRGYNNPAVESKLEAVVGGRPTDPVNGHLSPLRSNRSLLVERDFALNAQVAEHDLRRIQAVADIRHNITVVSGARDLRPGLVTPLSGFVPPALGAGDVKLDAQGMLSLHDNVRLPLPMSGVNQDDLDRLDLRAKAEHDLFVGYARALFPELPAFPATLRPAAWGRQSAAGLPQQLRTRFYGYGSRITSSPAPQLPVLASAFMTVNMLDAFDADNFLFSPFPASNAVDPGLNTPTAKTVLFSELFRTNLEADFQSPNVPKEFDTTDPANMGGRAHPWANWVNPAKLGRFDLNNGVAANQRLHTGSFTVPGSPIVPALNVYGIEAQPFITQIANMTVYTDTPETLGGDPDTQVQNPDGSYPDGITILGDLPTSGSWDGTDVVCRVVAFQLANPFDHDVVLSYGGPSSQFQDVDALNPPTNAEIDREFDFYYLEYCNNFYKLAWQRDEVDTAGNYLDKSTLRTLTVPAGKSIVVYSLNRPAKEIADRWVALGLAAGGATPEMKIREWLKNQFRGENYDFYQVPRFQPADIPGSTGFVMKDFNASIIDDANQAINRSAHLWRAQRAADFSGSSNDHEGARKTSVALPPPATGNALVWARNARENDRLVDRFVAPEGENLARKLDPGNQIITDAQAGPEGDTSYDNTGITFMMWGSARRRDFDASATAPGDRPLGVMPAWCIEPKSSTDLVAWNYLKIDQIRTTTPSLSNILESNVGDKTFDSWYITSSAGSDIDKIKSHPSTRSDSLNTISTATTTPGLPFEQVAGELFLDNKQFLRTVAPATVSSIRLADMLKPFCIGPFECPELGTGTLYRQALPTGPQSLANVDNRWVTLSQVLAVVYGYDSLAGTGLLPGATTSGKVLELYKPFTVTDTAGDTIPHKIHDRGHIVLDDFVPFMDSGAADRHLDLAVAAEYRTGMGVPLAMNILDNFTMASTLSGLTKAKPGLVNLNAATRPVLSAMPMFSPPANPGFYQSAWWWPAASPSALDSKTDIVSTLMAYRDKIPYELRHPSWTASTGTPESKVRYFGDGPRLPDDPTADGRDVTSEIRYIQESPGLRSLGELFAVRMRADYAGNTVLPSDPSNIDFRGYLPPPAPGVNVSYSHPGVVSVCYKDGGSVADKPAEAINSFSDKVDLANAAMTASTVRSDYFAVYFTVQGYQKADVENLQPTDPMVPSIRRRFLMIVDRSNVLKVGDKPRILAFKELPN